MYLGVGAMIGLLVVQNTLEYMLEENAVQNNFHAHDTMIDNTISYRGIIL